MLHKAIILAAGQGHRLLPLTKNKPKCLLKIGDRTILEHQIDRLLTAGIDDITIVTGYQASEIHTLMDNRVRWVHNKDYLATSSLYSFWLAREAAREGFVLLNSDVLFHEEILFELLASPYPDALTMEYNRDLGEEEMKIRVRQGKVAMISKLLKEFDGENLGIVKFSKEGGQRLLKTVEAIVRAGIFNVPIPYGFHQLAKHHDLFVVPTERMPWIEMDFAEDFEKAKQFIYPAILGMEGVKQAA